ncbi:hypothetical protein F5Y16DRAFT_372645 [Xylariaceae sp. FL0255]|nr:hypothetical protein F5Y16DRAFT_372645 [Xylariaceae sp. FL0255]
MKFFVKAAAAAALLSSVTAAPGMAVNKKGHVVKATTTTLEGQIIDWVVPESQVSDGKIATPPAPPAAPAKSRRALSPSSPSVSEMIARDPSTQGPEGTVPILRTSSNYTDHIVKTLPNANKNAKRQYAGTHWYASSAQYITNYGGKGTFSLFDAYTEEGSDFSLLQTAIIHGSAQAAAGTVTQTAEAGWINYPNQISPPHLFSYYTTDGYASEGDNIGGWNTEYAGWVQTDSTIYPGIAFSPLSTDGGSQYELEIGYYLTGGNWWLWCDGKYIGYYPASLYSNGASNAAETLGTYSNEINFYGEIYNSENAETTTDMGSGEFPSAGFGKSAYIHNIVYIDGSSVYQDYNGAAGQVVSDTSRYNYAPTWSSGTSWGSYFYIGGPGAGGQIGA